MDLFFPTLSSVGAGSGSENTASTALGKNGAAFQQDLMHALQQVNNQLHQADVMEQQMMLGQIHDVSQVMIEASKAQLSLELTIQLRNKVLEAYQDIMRMQI